MIEFTENGRKCGYGIGTEDEFEGLTTKLYDKVVVSLDEVSWEDAGSELKWAVLAKLSSGRPFRKNQLVDIFRKVWKLRDEAELFTVERNIMLVKLTNKEDHDKVLDGGPWMVEGEAILLQKWELGVTGDDFRNTNINIWIHIHGLPYELRRQDYANGFAMKAGVVQAQTGSKGKIIYEGEYTKSRISMDMMKPILPGLFLKRIGRKPLWISMKYEKLPNVCYKCGRLNHETKNCKEMNINLERKFGG